ncbi:MAG: hypothetical protein HFE61_08515 [Anaerotignum sp.]|nr:hypothetical protein [Anaerotignum sp.]
MAGGNEYTTRFNIDITDLKNGIQQANQLIRVANSEFKAATGGMDNWGNSADGLSAKLQQLDTVLGLQKAKLEVLQAEYRRVVEAEGEGSRGAQELYIKMNNLQGEIGRTEAQIRNYSARLNDIQTAQRGAADATEQSVNAYERLKRTIAEQESELNRLKSAYSAVVLEQGQNSSEARELAAQIQRLSGELNQNRSALAEAEQAANGLDDTLDDVGEAARDAGDGFTVMKGALANLVASGIKSLASGIKDGITSFLNLAEETREYREDLGKLETAFKTAGLSTELATKTYKDFYSVLGEEDRSVEAVNHLAKFVDTEQDMAKWTDICAGVWGTFGDSLPIEGLTEAANETAKVGQVTGPLADALNWAGESEDAFNEKLAACSSEQERAALITETLNRLYSEAAGNYRETNESIIEARRATSEYNDALAKLGEKSEPIMTKVKQGFADVLNAIAALLDGADFSQLEASIEAGFAYFINSVLPAIRGGFTWIIQNKEMIIGTVAGIGAAFAAIKIVGFLNSLSQMVGIIKSWTVVTKLQTAAQGLLNVAMNANPIGIIITAIGALIAIFATLWSTSEEFRAFWIGLWESLKEAVSGVVNAVVLFFTETIPTAWNNFLIFCGEFIAGIVEFFTQLPEKIGTAVAGVITAIIAWGADLVARGKEIGSDFLNAVVSFFSELPGRILEFISDALNHVKAWAADMAEKAKETGTKFLSQIVEFFKQVPVKIKEFVTAAFENVKTWAANMINKAKELGRDFVEGISGFFSQLPGKIQGFITTVFSHVAAWAANMANKAKEAGSAFLMNVVRFFSQLPGKVADYLSQVISRLASWAADMGRKGLEGAKEFFDAVIDNLKELPGEVLSIGEDIVHGLWEGISDAAGWLGKKVRGFASDIIDGMERALRIGSPSKVARDKIGRWIPEGVAVGIRDNAKKAVNASRDMAKRLMPTAETLKNDAGNAVPPLGISAVDTGRVAGNTTIFNQYNNSPKALSRLEIYRQTRNQLAFARGN